MYPTQFIVQILFIITPAKLNGAISQRQDVGPRDRDLSPLQPV